jgi:enamine deaminase RidA (YjgF/YER057c/UK114 family)
MRRFRSLAVAVAAAAALPSFAADVVRHPLPNKNPFPISMAVEVPAGKKIVFLSGMVGAPIDKAAAPGSKAMYGDTEAQTVSTLQQIDAALKSMKLQMKDVIKMQAFLVGDPDKNGDMDFAGFMKGYTQFFGPGSSNPNLPSRSAIKVAGLAAPGLLIEIEVTAVAPK